MRVGRADKLSVFEPHLGESVTVMIGDRSIRRVTGKLRSVDAGGIVLLRPNNHIRSIPMDMIRGIEDANGVATWL
jgi:hypothetical protein